MGICMSTESSDRGNSDENIVYVIGDNEEFCDYDDVNDGDGMRRLASLYSRQGKKGINQDSVILCQGFGMEEGIFCGVFDGHGRNGHTVSRLVRDYLPSLLLSQHNALLVVDGDAIKTDSDDCMSSSPAMFYEWKEACVGAFKAMDKELKLHSDLYCSYSGTTAVTIIKHGKDLIICNLGDSRAIMAMVSEQGHLKAIQLTTDLKPSVPQEAERKRKSNGRVFALRDEPNTQRVWMPNNNFPGLAMARAFGDLQMKNYGAIAIPQVSYRRLRHGDQFTVLATDGFLGFLIINSLEQPSIKTNHQMMIKTTEKICLLEDILLEAPTKNPGLATKKTEGVKIWKEIESKSIPTNTPGLMATGVMQVERTTTTGAMQVMQVIATGVKHQVMLVLAM